MAITFVASAGASSGASTSTTLVISAPAGIQAGDVLVAAIACRSDPTLTTPLGWTQVLTRDHTATSLDAYVYTRVASASEPSAYTWTFSTAVTNAGIIAAYRGVNNTTPVDVSGSQENASGTTVTAPAVTTTVANARLLGIYFNAGGITTTPPGGQTERDDQRSTSGGGNCAVALADETVAATGSTGTRAATLGTASNNIGALVALMDAAGGGGGGGGGGAADYYVAASGGNNANPGTLSQPWATVAYALSTAPGGSTIALLDGTHSVASSITTFNSGSASDYTILRAANPGAAIIDITSDINIFFGTGVDYLRFQDLIFDGVAPSTVNSLLRWNGCDYIEFINCEARNSNSYLIRFYGGSTNGLVDGCILHHEDYTNYGKDAVLIDGAGTTATVRNCTMYHSPHSGVYVDAGATATVHDNTIYDNASHAINCVAATLIAYNNRLSGSGAWNRQDLVDWKHGYFIKDAANCTIHHDEIFDCVGAAIGFKDHTGTVTIDNQTWYNNNTAGYNEACGLYMNNTSATAPLGITVRNVIMYHTMAGERVHYFTRNGGADPGTIDIDQNLYYVSGGAETCYWFGTTYTSLSDWRTARESSNTIIGSDPLFASLTSRNFALQSGSPAIDAGVDVGWDYTGSAPDLGANEFGAAAALAFVSFPTSATVSLPLTTFTLEARTAGGSLDTAFTGTITLTRVSGAGTLGGTLARAAVAGVATFNDITISATGAHVIQATASGLTAATSGTLNVITAGGGGSGGGASGGTVVAPVLGGAEYVVRLYNASGVQVAEISDYLNGLSYTKHKYALGQAVFSLPGNHPAVSTLEYRGQVEIRRRNARFGLGWYTDFYGLLVGDEEWSGASPEKLTLYVPEQRVILGRRTVAYDAGVANRSQFAAARAETILKTLVQYNATSSGTTADGRQRDATSSGAVDGWTITLEADGANGNLLDWECANANLLKTLTDLAYVAGGEWGLVKTGATTWQFRWYTTRRGVDRSAAVIFAPGNGNMGNPRYAYRRSQERAVAIVGGSGVGPARTYAVRTGADYAVATNSAEVFVNGSAAGSNLNAVGDAELYKARARREFDFDVLQTPASYYGLHYCVDGVMGDLVTARYRNVSATVEVVGVTVDFEGGQERIQPELATYG